MYNFFRNIFGSPSEDNTRRNGNNLRDQYLDREDANGLNAQGHDDFSFESFGEFRLFSFPLFADPFQIHKQFEKMINEMEQQFSRFGIEDFHNPHFGSNEIIDQPEEDSAAKLREYYLKDAESDFNFNKKRDYVLDGDVSASDVNNLLKIGDATPSQGTALNKPAFTSQYQTSSVKITVQPDGSGEVVQTRRDSSGKVETIIKKFSSSK